MARAPKLSGISSDLLGPMLGALRVAGVVARPRLPLELRQHLF